MDIDQQLTTRTNKFVLDAVVIGAGHAELCTSWNLKQRGLRHLVFETKKIGVQVAEDLINSGRNVYLSTSKVARMPREKNLMDGLSLSGFMDHRPDDPEDPHMLQMKQPQIID